MNKTLLFIITLCAFLLPGNVVLGAEELLIDYTEGIIQVKEGSKWIEVFEDDVVESESVIKLDDDSMVELSGRSLSITLINPGVYHLLDIIAKSKDSSKYGIDDIVSAKFAALLENAGVNEEEGAVMGVRAASLESEIDFIGDEIIETIFRTAKEEISKGKYAEGLSLLEDAYDWASEDNESILLYYIGFCYNKLGKDALSISYLVDIIADPEMPFYSEYVILYGSLLMNSFAHDQALELFTEYFEYMTPETSAEYQDISYLAALCYMHQNNIDKTYTYLKKAKNIDPKSDTGKKAGLLLQELE